MTYQTEQLIKSKANSSNHLEVLEKNIADSNITKPRANSLQLTNSNYKSNEPIVFLKQNVFSSSKAPINTSCLTSKLADSSRRDNSFTGEYSHLDASLDAQGFKLIMYLPFSKDPLNPMLLRIKMGATVQEVTFHAYPIRRSDLPFTNT